MEDQLIRIAMTGCTHGHLPKVPECDILIHTGDWSPVFSHDAETQLLFLAGPFSNWLADAPANLKVVVAGNHDFVANTREGMRILRALSDEGVYYLCGERLSYDGLLIYGEPHVPTFFNWAFMENEDKLADIYRAIPEFLDILITHGPPHGILDQTNAKEQVGSAALAEQLEQTDFGLHVFSHIHEARGSIHNFFNVSHGYGSRPNPFVTIDYNRKTREISAPSS